MTRLHLADVFLTQEVDHSVQVAVPEQLPHVVAVGQGKDAHSDKAQA